jgi:phage gp45-like
MIGQIWNRLQLMIAQARGVRVGHDKIQVNVLDNEPLTNIDRIEPYGFSYRPKAGCQAYIVFPSGDRTRGFALIVGDRQYNLVLEEGEVALHDDLGQKVHLTRTGMVIDGAGMPITLTNTPKARIEADLEVTGNIKDQCDTAAGKTMAGMRAIYSGHNHPGDSGGTTGNPNQDM